MNKLFSVLCMAAQIFLMAACSATHKEQFPDATTTPEIHHVEGRFDSPPHEEFTSSRVTIAAYDDFHKPRRIEAAYPDGAEMLITSDQCEDLNSCRVVEVSLGPDFEALMPLDGRRWMDTQVWLLMKLHPKSGIFETCRNGHIYGSANPTTLMDALEEANGAQNDAARHIADAELAKLLVDSDAASSKLPVCGWRHRMGLDAVLPPKYPLNVSAVLPSSHDPAHIEITAKNTTIKIYLTNTQPPHFDFMVLQLPHGHSLSIRPVINPPQCTSMRFCTHYALNFDGNRGDLETLDGKWLGESHELRVTNAVTHKVTYCGCENGRLYANRDRETLERAMKDTSGNPIPTGPQNSARAPAISSEGDTIMIPSAICDWSSRKALTTVREPQNLSAPGAISIPK